MAKVAKAVVDVVTAIVGGVMNVFAPGSGAASMKLGYDSSGVRDNPRSH
jgi:hypothetical protein